MAKTLTKSAAVLEGLAEYAEEILEREYAQEFDSCGCCCCTGECSMSFEAWEELLDANYKIF